MKKHFSTTLMLIMSVLWLGIANGRKKKERGSILFSKKIDLGYIPTMRGCNNGQR